MRIIKVGRDPDNDVVIDDVYVSRHHLQIIQNDDNSVSLVDAGSHNGTFVNGQKIQGSVRLYPRDVVRIGNTELPWWSYVSSGETVIQDNEHRNTYNGNRQNYNQNYNRQSYSNQQGGSSETNNNEKNPSNSNGMVIFIFGLAALGIDIYLIINFYSKISTVKKLIGGSLVDYFSFFPAYLKYADKWVWMIVALLLGLVATFGNKNPKDEQSDPLVRYGKHMGLWSVLLSIGFILLALFADDITESVVKSMFS